MANTTGNRMPARTGVRQSTLNWLGDVSLISRYAGRASCACVVGTASAPANSNSSTRKARNAKFETRMKFKIRKRQYPKQIIDARTSLANRSVRSSRSYRFELSSVSDIRACFEFRYSNFEFRISFAYPFLQTVYSPSPEVIGISRLGGGGLALAVCLSGGAGRSTVYFERKLL